MFKNKNRPSIYKKDEWSEGMGPSFNFFLCIFATWDCGQSLSRTEIPGESDIELFCVTLYLCTAKPGDTGQGHGDRHIIRS